MLQSLKRGKRWGRGGERGGAVAREEGVTGKGKSLRAREKKREDKN